MKCLVTEIRGINCYINIYNTEHYNYIYNDTITKYYYTLYYYITFFSKSIHLIIF